MRWRAHALGALALAAAIAGCGGESAPRAHVPMVLESSGDELARVRAGLDEASRDLPVDLGVAEVPGGAPDDVEAGVDFGTIRAAYDDGDLEACLAALPDEARVSSALAGGDRTTASRALFWRMACLRALGREAEALSVAHEHAVRELPLPDDVGSANAIAERLVRDAHREAAAVARVPVALESVPAGARVSVDGLTRDERTPCTIGLLPGPHLVTFTHPLSESAVVGLEVHEGGAPPPVRATLTRVEPGPAAQALAARRDEGRALDDDLSLALLAVSLRSRALVLVSHDSDRTRAALVTLEDDAVRGTVVRAERVGDAQWQLRGLLEDVLVRGSLMAPPPELYERAELWIAVAAAIAIGAGVALGLTLQPDVQTRVTW